MRIPRLATRDLTLLSINRGLQLPRSHIPGLILHRLQFWAFYSWDCLPMYWRLDYWSLFLVPIVCLDFYLVCLLPALIIWPVMTLIIVLPLTLLFIPLNLSPRHTKQHGRVINKVITTTNNQTLRAPLFNTTVLLKIGWSCSSNRGWTIDAGMWKLGILWGYHRMVSFIWKLCC